MHVEAHYPHKVTLTFTQALALVCGVLLVHLWLLSGSALWFSSQETSFVKTPTLITRQLEAPRAPADEPLSATRTHREMVHPEPASPLAWKAPSQTPAPPHAWASPRELEDLQAQLTAPVALPARSAEAVDLPPFHRPAPDAGGSIEVTSYKAPHSARLRYDVKGQASHIGYSAWANLDWQQDGQAYNARLEVGAFLLGSRVQTSVGVLGPEGVMPTRFADKSRSELAAHFQRDKNIISFGANTPDAPLIKGAQDRLSVLLQLGALVGADRERFPIGTMLSVPTVSQREVEIWQFVVEKEEWLHLPYGDIHSLKLSRQPRREFDQRIELWLAPSLDYLPARLRITNANGDFVDQLLRTMETPGS